MSSSNAPCAACKIQRRKCASDCVFAPYFPPDQPQKFQSVHKVFGASNVSKLLQDLAPESREDAANSLAYEAEARLRDPVYGCVGLISILQHRLRQIQSDLQSARSELSNYIGPAAMLPIMPPTFAPRPGLPPPLSAYRNRGPGIVIDSNTSQNHYFQQHQQLQILEHQQLLAEEQQYAAAIALAKQQEEMVRITLEQHKLHAQDLMSVQNGTDLNNGNGNLLPASVTVNAGNALSLVSGGEGFNQTLVGSTDLALGNATFGNCDVHVRSHPHHHQFQLSTTQTHHNNQHQVQERLMLESPQSQTQQNYQLGFLRKLDGVANEGKRPGSNNGPTYS